MPIKRQDIEVREIPIDPMGSGRGTFAGGFGDTGAFGRQDVIDPVFFPMGTAGSRAWQASRPFGSGWLTRDFVERDLEVRVAAQDAAVEAAAEHAAQVRSGPLSCSIEQLCGLLRARVVGN